MKYSEWQNLKLVKDDLFPLSHLYFYPSGECFYIEPSFYSQLIQLKQIYPCKYQEVLKKMESIVLEHKKVVFTHNYEAPYVDKEGFVYREITDIMDALNIYVEDKSRGSDYGD